MSSEVDDETIEEHDLVSPPQSQRSRRNIVSKYFSSFQLNSSQQSNKRVTSNSNKKTTKASLGITVLDRLIRQAEYELNYDAYRGLRIILDYKEEIQLKKKQEQSKSDVSNEDEKDRKEGDNDENKLYQRLEDTNFPFLKCISHDDNRIIDEKENLSFGESDDDNNTNNGNVLESQYATTVHKVCGSICPSLTDWTCKAQSQFAKKQNNNNKTINKRKRKIMDSINITESNVAIPPFGKRPRDLDTYKCACDYNMFCVTSLGGVMDEILTEQYNKLHADKTGIIIIDEDENVDSKKRDEICDPKNIKLYGTTTSQQLERVRQSKNVAEKPIRYYLAERLLALASVMSINDCIDAIRNHHKSLMFTNPLLKPFDNNREHADDDKIIELSIPPGIENLGATCYLNTQLQCLAMNRVFVDGILSWRPGTLPNNTTPMDRMTSVISLFQQLLARLQVGPYSSVSTQDFSDALGLDHFEQQDPNEFSRLFLERLHEAFQETSSLMEPGRAGEGHDPGTLLPHLFEGEIEYETKCVSCNNASRMTEKFMDLNLPIVKQSTKTSGQQTLADAFLKADNDTDVQYCLDQYCCSENLDGDNQYMCSSCNVKRDATRSLNFRKLPPILNVQLSRYVFDRSKGMKQKKSDPVLLPRELSVKSFSSHTCKNVSNRYILCAVMRHQGVSAYSGHYVAEAMDWVTGQWFEFNDEKVSVLVDGPSCSYLPTKPAVKFSKVNGNNSNTSSLKENERKSPTQKSKGSQDAYNMYYVEESFLAQNILENLRKMRVSTFMKLGTGTVLHSVESERGDYYNNLSQMCIDDGIKQELMEQRRNRIRNGIFRSPFRNELPNDQDDIVWVEGDVLRRFLSCQREHDIVRSIERISTLPCPHQKLHPRVAHKGKILTKKVGDEFVSALSLELQEHYGDRTRSICGKVAINTTDVICDKCENEYRTELQNKLSTVENLKLLNEDLNRKESTFGLDLELGETFGNECDQFAYVVSSKFATWFRNKMSQLMKKLAQQNEESANSGEGIDSLNLSDLLASHNDSSITVSDEISGFALVNEAITCSHGNLKNISRSSYMFVPFRTWRIIRNFFPCAIEHKIKRRGFVAIDVTDESDDDSIQLSTCYKCREMVNFEDEIRDQLLDFITFCKCDAKRFESHSAAQAIDAIYMSQEQVHKQYRFIRKEDIESFQNFLQDFKRKLSKSRPERVRDCVAGVMINSSSPTDKSFFVDDTVDGDVKQCEVDRLEFVSSLIHPIICTKHRHVLHASVSGKPSSPESSYPGVGDDIRIMEEEDYKAFLARFVAIVMITIPDTSRKKAEASNNWFLEEAVQFCRKWKVDSAHPKFFFSASTDCPCSMVITNEAMSVVLSVDQPICQDQHCNQLYLQFKGDDSTRKQANVNAHTKPHNGTSANNPIGIDCDVDSIIDPDLISIRVFEIEANATYQDALAALSTLLLIVDDANPDQSLRRSSRKRKTRYPSGIIVDEETIRLRLDYNVAALRLVLNEQCMKGSQFEVDHSITFVSLSEYSRHPLPFDGTDLKDRAGVSTTTPGCIFLALDRCNETLHELYNSIGVEPTSDSFVSDDLVILRQANSAKQDSKLHKDELFNQLLHLANTTSDTSPKAPFNSSTKKVKRQTERGFTGTFLSSVTMKSCISNDKDRELESQSSTEKLVDSSYSQQFDSYLAERPVVAAADQRKHMNETYTDVDDAVTEGSVKSVEEEISEVSSPSSIEKDRPKSVLESSERSDRSIDMHAYQTFRGTNRYQNQPSDSSESKQYRVDSLQYLEEVDDESDCRSHTNSDDMIISQHCKVQGKTIDSRDSRSTRTTSESDHMWNIDAGKFELIQRLTMEMLKNPDIREDQQEICFRAAAQAVEKNPNYDFEALADPAYACFVSLTDD